VRLPPSQPPDAESVATLWSTGVAFGFKQSNNEEVSISHGLALVVASEAAVSYRQGKKSQNFEWLEERFMSNEPKYQVVPLESFRLYTVIIVGA